MADQGARNIDRVDCRRGSPHPQSTSPLEGQRSTKVVYLSTFNKSCESCGYRRRKCDGGHPCRRCIGNGEGHLCTYSKRRARTPRMYNTNPTPTATKCTKAIAPAFTGDSTRGNNASSGEGVPSLKRCRLSASPATGLVGMKENAFLRDFFGCIGFLPLTSRSQIRETIIIMMANPNWSGEGNGEEALTDTSSTLVDITSRDMVLGEIGLEMGPSMCIFWCACALGALVTGRPNESVEGYFHMAKTALDASSGGPTAEVARYPPIEISLTRPDVRHALPIRAWTSLAYVNGFMGNMAGFRGYLQLAEAFVVECKEGGREDILPAGFAEIVKAGDNAKAYAGDLDVRDLREEDAPAAPEMGEFPTEGELFRFCFVVSRKMLAPALFGIVNEQRALLKRLAEEGMKSTWSSAERAVAAAATGQESGKNWKSHDMATHQRSVGQSRVLDELEAKLKHSWSAFQRLEEAAERTLAVVKAITRDQRGVLESTKRSIEVVERYPGLLHFVMGLHDAHLFAALVATIDDPEAGELYDRVRTLFNATRPPGWRPIPPFEEWQGVSACCDHAHCRSMGMVLEMSSLRARGYEDPPIRANTRLAPKWTRTAYAAPARAREYRESIGASIEAIEVHDHSSPIAKLEKREGAWATGAAGFDPLQGTNPRWLPTATGGLGVAHGKADHHVASCNTYNIAGSELSPSWCEMRRVTAKLHPDSSAIGAEHWLGFDNAIHIGAAPNAPPNGVAFVALGTQQNKLESESEDAIDAEDWSDVSHALLHSSS